MSSLRNRDYSTRLLVASVLLALFFSAVARAEEVSVKAYAEPTAVAVGGEVTLVIKVEGRFRKTAEPELPPLDDFEVYRAGTSQSFSFVNGQRSASLEFTYVLVPKKEGVYTIEPIRFQIGDNTYTADPVRIEVLHGTAQAPPPAAVPYEAPQAVTDSPIFILAKVDRHTVYVNQQVTWTLGFYSDGRVSLLRTPEYTPPSAEGFWVEDLPPQRNYQTAVRARRYTVNEIARGFFPTAPGEYTIGPARVEVVLDDFSTGRLDDFFNLRPRAFGFGKPKTLTTEAFTITVLPLPQSGKPANFSGLVGRDMSITLRSDKQVAQAGEPINVTLEIGGEGNFKTMSVPGVPELPGFKMYESGSTSDLFKENYRVSGRKKSDFVVIARNEGRVQIPPITLSYFDPIEASYKLVRSNSIELDIKPAAREEGRQVVFAGGGEDIEVLSRDIHFIHPVPAAVSTGGRPFYARPIYLALHAVPLLGLALSLAVERRRRRWREDLPYARASRAGRAAERRLRDASRMAGAGKAAEACAEVSLALRGYLGDKMNASPSGLTFEAVAAYLSARSVAAEDIEKLSAVLRACDAAQYARVAPDGDAALRTAAAALDVVRKLEKEYFHS